MKKINETALVRLLKDKGLSVSTAESLTGGMIACKITSVPGASSVIQYGFVTYSDTAKNKILGVKKETLQAYTAVSKETAKEMALGALKASDSDLAVAVTGYAGPDAGKEPAGTVYMCAAAKGGMIYEERLSLIGDREAVRKSTAEKAISTLYDIACGL